MLYVNIVGRNLLSNSSDLLPLLNPVLMIMCPFVTR